MSTKIYNGKKLPNMSVLELHRFCQELKSTLIPIAMAEYHKMIANIAQYAYVYMVTNENVCKYHVDMTKLDKLKDNFTPNDLFFFAYEETNRLVNQTSSAVRRVDAVSDADFDVTICIFPLSDKTLCIPYANHEALSNALMDCDKFEEYGYWDNTDPPSELNDYEWHQRKCDWDEALPGIGIPSKCGLSLKIVDAVCDVAYGGFPTIQDIIPHLTDDDTLCESIAKKIIVEREFQKCLAEFGEDYMGHLVSCLNNAEQYAIDHADEVTALSDTYKGMCHSVEFFNSGI